MSNSDRNGSEGPREGENNTSPKRVIAISVLPVSVSMRAPMVDGSGGKVAYSNHDLGLVGIPMETPITFTLGDKESEEQAILVMVASLDVVARAVAMAFQRQVDRQVRSDPTRPSPPKKL